MSKDILITVQVFSDIDDAEKRTLKEEKHFRSPDDLLAWYHNSPWHVEDSELTNNEALKIKADQWFEKNEETASCQSAYLAGAKESNSTAIADFILLLRERCEDHRIYAEGRLVNHDNPDDAWGETYSANDLLKYAEELKLKLKMEGK